MLNNKSIKEMIEYIGDDYSRILVEYIKKEYEIEEINNLNLHFVIEKDNAIKNNIKNFLLDNKKQRIAKSLMLIGILYAFIGILFYFFAYYKNKIFDIENIFLLISIIGLFIAFIGIFVLFYFRVFSNYKIKNVDHNEQFIRYYNILESILINKAPDSYIVDGRVTGKGLSYIKELSENDILKIKQIRSLRNIIFHKTKGIINDDKVKKIMSECKNLIAKLK